MKLGLSLSLSLVAFLWLAGQSSLATTWEDSEKQCPICGNDLQVKVPASYGSYVYNWPSKYQLVFWPDTVNDSFYFCPECHLSVMMGDFDSIPADKHEAIKKAIEPLKVDDVGGLENPIAYRLMIAQAVYEQLDKDEVFWCSFFRIKGYHLDQLGKGEDARKARIGALELAKVLLTKDLDFPPEKELVFIIGSMQYFVGQVDEARATLKKVADAPVQTSKYISAEDAEGYGKYLDGLAVEFLDMIEKGEKVPQ